MKNILGLVCLLLLVAVQLFAQEKNSANGQFQVEQQRTEMQKLDKMAGKWSGAGWIQQGPNREEFTGTENVQRKLDGLALLVEGRFTAKNDPNKVIHETLAVLNYNPKTTIYDFKTYLANGSNGSFAFKLVEDGYEWGMDYPGAKMRYTIIIKDGIWNEVGKISRDDGKTWLQFFEMNLKKN